MAQSRRGKGMQKSRLFAVVAASTVVVAALAGCVQGSATPSKSPSASVAPTPTATADPTLVSGGTAAQNKAYFDLVNNKLFAANGSADGRTIIDNLAAAGFDKGAMQVTPDKTSINDGVDSILFSIHIQGSCLLGQHGGAGYASSVAAALTGGVCLVGKTRPINW